MLFYYDLDHVPLIPLVDKKPLVYMEITGTTGSSRAPLLILSEYLLAVYHNKIPFSFSFFVRKSILVLALPLGNLASHLKKLRWTLLSWIP